ncbi:unnamed protein product, partial [Mesorhabditis spiculigera]
MAERTRADPREMKRRESHLREAVRHRELRDPFTWEYRWKMAATIGGLGAASAHAYNIWTRKPWYYAAFPRLAAISALGYLGYCAGVLREHHNKTRDAIVEHYISLHPEDFDHIKDRNGRPWSNVLLPWYPHRSQYTKYDAK